jgi:hypothetical protein
MTGSGKNVAGYLLRHAEPDQRPFHAGSLEGIERAVVIPALAEFDSLFAALASLAQNPPDALSRTLVLCVVNNRRRGACDPADYRNNQATLTLLSALIRGGDVKGIEDLPAADVRLIRESGLRLACVDASSEGYEMPDKGAGVGLARKIGMDKALRLFGPDGGAKLICCLDADTKVAADYLPQVARGFARAKGPAAAAVAYAHERPSDPELAAAILNYEIYLRYYVCSLQNAGSPYAFHTIGSAMAVTAGAYASVRGINRLEAAEDFYFLNKLAKVGPVARIDTTRVYPAARASARVPFGTGRRMIQSLAGEHDGHRLYHPRIFHVLAQWLAAVARDPDRSGSLICDEAAGICRALSDFLSARAFPDVWEKIRRNSRNVAFLTRQFHVWFDGFLTLKLIHWLNDRAFPPVTTEDGLRELFEGMGVTPPVPLRSGSPVAGDEGWAMLQFLRRLAP